MGQWAGRLEEAAAGLLIDVLAFRNQRSRDALSLQSGQSCTVPSDSESEALAFSRRADVAGERVRVEEQQEMSRAAPRSSPFAPLVIAPLHIPADPTAPDAVTEHTRNARCSPSVVLCFLTPPTGQPSCLIAL